MALATLPFLILVWHCQSDGANSYAQAEKAKSGADSLRCNPIPSKDDSMRLMEILSNPFTLEYDNFFKYRKDYYSYDSMYLYRYWFVRYINITCVVYKKDQDWYFDTYYYNEIPGKTKKFYRSKSVSQGVIDAFQRRLEDLNYKCLPICIDTIDILKRKRRESYGSGLTNSMVISCSGRRHYFYWGEFDGERYYRERDNKSEEQIRSAIAHLISDAGFPKPEMQLFAYPAYIRDSIGLHLALTEDLLIDSILQWRTPSPITLRFEKGKDYQRIHKSKAHLLDSIAVEVLMYTGEHYWLRPPKIYWE
ncbi:MAG: hypothetical protein J0L99_00300 [Chitinophagales bacterium]|nr:hypothetical protein [Chitinophagales bacterium]